MKFLLWLESQGCHVAVTQPDDGSGFIVAVVVTPDRAEFEISVETK